MSGRYALVAIGASLGGLAAIRIVLRRGSGAIHWVFDYHVRELPGEDIQFVGVKDPVASDSR